MPRKLKLDGLEILEQIREAAREVHGEMERDYDPLVEMGVYAADPSLPPALKFAANKEVAQYVYPKRKAVEHDGAGDTNIYLVKFSEDADEGFIVDQRPERRLTNESESDPPTH